MVNKTLLLFVLFSSCRSEKKQKIEIDYDYKYVTIENEIFFIEKIKIFNSIGNTLYELRLNSDEVGLSKIFLFQSPSRYIERGNLESIRNDTLEKYIQVEIHSRDMQKIEMFEGPFKNDSRGKKIIAPIKESYP